MAVGYMIDCGRHITLATTEYRAGKDAEPRMGRQLKGATLGILGYGAIGEYLAKLGVALGMTVLVNDPFKTVKEPGRRAGRIRRSGRRRPILALPRGRQRADRKSHQRGGVGR